jgi:hypothetical protein
VYLKLKLPEVSVVTVSRIVGAALAGTPAAYKVKVDPVMGAWPPCTTPDNPWSAAAPLVAETGLESDVEFSMFPPPDPQAASSKRALQTAQTRFCAMRRSQ